MRPDIIRHVCKFPRLLLLDKLVVTSQHVISSKTENLKKGKITGHKLPQYFPPNVCVGKLKCLCGLSGLFDRASGEDEMITL